MPLRFTAVLMLRHFGNVRAIQKRVFGLDEAFGTNLENPDFMTLAKAFRVPGAIEAAMPMM